MVARQLELRRTAPGEVTALHRVASSGFWGLREGCLIRLSRAYLRWPGRPDSGGAAGRIVMTPVTGESLRGRRRAGGDRGGLADRGLRLCGGDGGLAGRRLWLRGSGPAPEQALGQAGPAQARIAAVPGGAVVARRAGGVGTGGVALAAQVVAVLR